MPTTSLMPEPRQRYYNNNGTVAAGCKLYSYAAGTSTPKATYTDSAGTTPHANPIVLDSKGEALIYWDGSYKVDLKTAAGVQVTGYPVDNYVSVDALIAASDATLRADLAAPTGAGMVGVQSALSGAVADTLDNWLDFDVHLLKFVLPGYHAAILDGTSTYDVQPDLQSLINTLNAAGGGIIGLPRGLLKIGNYVEMKSNVGLLGQGDCTVFRAMFAAPINRMITSPAATLQANISLRNFKVDRTATNTQHGILMGGTSDLIIDNVHVYGFGPGYASGAIGISPFDSFAQIQSINPVVSNCRITQACDFGIAFGNVTGGRVTKNTFYDCFREVVGFEAWGDGTNASGNNPLLTLGVIENCIASENICYMDTRAGNHHTSGSFPGPALFMGGASSKGRCINSGLVDNTVFITNTAALTSYIGIACWGAATLKTEGCFARGNIVVNAPSHGIQVGVAGFLTENIVVSDNLLVNPNSAVNAAVAGSAIYAEKSLSGVFSDNVITGTNHTYNVASDNNSSLNYFLDNAGAGFTIASESLANTTDIVRSPKGFVSNDLAQIINEGVTLADGATATLKSRGTNIRGVVVVSSTSGGNYALLVFNTTGAVPVVISKSTDVVVGTTDPGTAGALSVYPLAGGKIGITNRLGSTKTVSVTSFCAI